jgi:hypothetical protein
MNVAEPSGGRSGSTGRGKPDRRPDRSISPESLSASILAPRRAAERPVIQPVDPAFPSKCLCGDPADFIVETNWFSGRRSRDPVCEYHVAEVVAAITKKRAQRDGG